MKKQTILKYIREADLQTAIDLNKPSGQAKAIIRKLRINAISGRVVSIKELMKASGLEYSGSVIAKIRVLQTIGCVEQCAEGYRWILNDHHWPEYANIYRKHLCIKAIEQTVMKNLNEYTKGFGVRCQLEIEQLENQIEQIREDLVSGQLGIKGEPVSDATNK